MEEEARLAEQAKLTQHQKKDQLEEARRGGVRRLAIRSMQDTCQSPREKPTGGSASLLGSRQPIVPITSEPDEETADGVRCWNVSARRPRWAIFQG
jgi:hypothetical protein